MAKVGGNWGSPTYSANGASIAVPLVEGTNIVAASDSLPIPSTENSQRDELFATLFV